MKFIIKLLSKRESVTLYKFTLRAMNGETYEMDWTTDSYGYKYNAPNPLVSTKTKKVRI